MTQAIDYGSDVASWGTDKIREICAKYTGESLEDVLSEAFPDSDLENLAINQTQRIILVGFAIEPALERMIEWLSGAYGVGINAVSLKYIRTSAGNEVLTPIRISKRTLAIQQLEGNVLTPRIQGEAVNLPSVLIFLGVIAGGQIAGLLGVLFAVPTLAVLRVLFDFFRARLQTEG